MLAELLALSVLCLFEFALAQSDRIPNRSPDPNEGVSRLVLGTVTPVRTNEAIDVRKVSGPSGGTLSGYTGQNPCHVRESHKSLEFLLRRRLIGFKDSAQFLFPPIEQLQGGSNGLFDG